MEFRDEHIENLLFGYFAGELSEAQEKELSEWLEADESNKKVMADMADWWATAHVPLFKSDMKADFDKYFGEIIHPRETLNPHRRTFTLSWKNIAASVAVLMLVSSLSFYGGTLRGKSSGEISQPYELFSEVITPLGATSKVVLPDGSVVWVNAGSTLKYNYDYNQSVRQVSLLGEAYFEVMHDPLKPFIVKSEELDIQVMGTTFNVKAYQDDQEVDVSLVTGSVNVHVKGVETGEVLLSPDRMLSFNRQTNDVEVIKIIGKDAMAWTDGRVKFTEQPFPRIAKDLERKFNVKIQIESERLKKETFSGSFTSSHTLEQILREVDVERKYTWTQNRNEIVIRDRRR